MKTDKHVRDIQRQLIDKIMRYHRKYYADVGESDCIEVYNQHYTIISDSHCIDEKGRESIIPQEEANLERVKERCSLCQYLRKLREAKN